VRPVSSPGPVGDDRAQGWRCWIRPCCFASAWSSWPRPGAWSRRPSVVQDRDPSFTKRESWSVRSGGMAEARTAPWGIVGDARLALRPGGIGPRHKSKRGIDSRNRIRRRPLHRIPEDRLRAPFQPPPARPLQRPVSRRSAFHRTGSTNAPPGGQRRSPMRTYSRERSLPYGARPYPMMFPGGIRLAIHSSASPISPLPWLAERTPCPSLAYDLVAGSGMHGGRTIFQGRRILQDRRRHVHGIASRGQTSRAPR